MKQILTLLPCLFFLNSFSSVIYRNINQTLTQHSNQSYSLDVNGDGSTDYLFLMGYDYQTATNAMQIIPGTANTSNGPQSDWADANPETFGQQVGANPSWSVGYDLYTYDTTHYTGGAFQHGQFYIGVSFFIGQSPYLGWVRVSTPNADTLIIYDCAYSNVSGGGLTVGQTATGIEQVNYTDVKLQWLNGLIYINGADKDITGGILKVSDLTGKILLSQQLESSSQDVPFNAEAKGIYIAAIYLNNNDVITRKILLQ